MIPLQHFHPQTLNWGTPQLPSAPARRVPRRHPACHPASWWPWLGHDPLMSTWPTPRISGSFPHVFAIKQIECSTTRGLDGFRGFSSNSSSMIAWRWLEDQLASWNFPFKNDFPRWFSSHVDLPKGTIFASILCIRLSIFINPYEPTLGIHGWLSTTSPTNQPLVTRPTLNSAKY